MALEVTPNGRALAAWINDSLTEVHITPLDATLARQGDDIIVEGSDLGGLVTHDDGFALVTRRVDSGADTAVTNEDRPQMAAALVRYRNGEEAFAISLTGTDGIDGARDYCNLLSSVSGQLSWDGEHYTAYFETRLGAGHAMDGIYVDKLVVVDAAGQAANSGWSGQCSAVRGLLLHRTSDALFAFCLSDVFPEPPGLYKMTAGDDPLLISEEDSWSGYSGASLGDIVSLKDGANVLVWGSRGFDAPADAHDINLLQLDERFFEPLGDRKRLTNTDDIDEVNVHAAPYGPDSIAVIWNTLEWDECRDGTCFGAFAGTRVQLFSPDGTPLTDAEIIPAPPTWQQDIAILPDGDLAWVFIVEAPDYQNPLDVNSLPSRQTLRIARLDVCTRQPLERNR